jgi:tetratricopeptide (TPR) repeat protein
VYHSFTRCYYRKAGKLRTALRYVTDALKIEAGLPNSAKASDTHLNMCTILSELGAHDKAVLHARMALKLLLIELFGPPPEPAGAEDGQEEEEKAPELPADRVAVLAIAYHNLAVQQECLSKYPQSLESYDKALKVVTKHLGQAHPLASTLGESLKVATAKLQPKIDRQRNIDHDANERRRQALGMTTSKRRSKQPSSPSSSKVQQQQQQHDDLNTSVASNDGEEELTQEELPQESLYVSEGEL